VLASTDASVVGFWRDVIERTAWLRFILGDWDGAVELLERGEALIGPSERVIADALLARITALRGRFDLAEEHLAAAHARVPPDEAGCPLSLSREVPLAEVELHLARGDIDRAWAVVVRLLRAPLHGHGIEVDRESVLMGARVLAGMSDRPSGAEELVLSATERVVAMDRLDAAWRSEVQLRLASSSDPDRWRDVVAAWDSVGHAHHGCVARAALAAALLTSRQREEATDVLASAVTVAEGLGAAPLLGRLRSIAAAARLPVGSASQGQLPREARRLTEREFEVLELVAAGRSNHDIADELFISHKTASVHVSHIIAKLEVSNRTEAAAYAHQNGILPPPAP
jgi:DNA-binding NarL/FixJ family response regulator